MQPCFCAVGRSVGLEVDAHPVLRSICVRRWRQQCKVIHRVLHRCAEARPAGATLDFETIDMSRSVNVNKNGGPIRRIETGWLAPVALHTRGDGCELLL